MCSVCCGHWRVQLKTSPGGAEALVFIAFDLWDAVGLKDGGMEVSVSCLEGQVSPQATGVPRRAVRVCLWDSKSVTLLLVMECKARQDHSVIWSDLCSTGQHPHTNPARKHGKEVINHRDLLSAMTGHEAVPLAMLTASSIPLQRGRLRDLSSLLPGPLQSCLQLDQPAQCLIKSVPSPAPSA